MIKDLWTKTKAFFKFSVTILLARITALTGLIVAAVGSMNWAPLLGLNVDTGFNRNQIVWLGLLAFAQGITFELARRRSLIPESS